MSIDDALNVINGHRRIRLKLLGAVRGILGATAICAGLASWLSGSSGRLAVSLFEAQRCLM